MRCLQQPCVSFVVVVEEEEPGSAPTVGAAGGRDGGCAAAGRLERDGGLPSGGFPVAA